MNNTTRFPHLMKSALFRDLPEAFCARFLDEATVKTFEPGETVIEQGQQITGAFIIAHGSVEITSINSEGQAVLIHLYRQGQVIGEVETLAESTAAAQAAAAVKCQLLFISHAQMLAAAQHALFLRNIMRASVDRLTRDNSLKFVDQFYPVEQRLADYLYRLSTDRPEIPKTQADLAGLMGCARQTLNRELGRLRESNVIRMEKGKILVLDRAGLLARAQGKIPPGG